MSDIKFQNPTMNQIFFLSDQSHNYFLILKLPFANQSTFLYPKGDLWYPLIKTSSNSDSI